MSQINVDTIKNRLGTSGPTLHALTVTNDATVGGALTVTGNFTVNSSINTTGIITATSFSGSGSGLTGIATFSSDISGGSLRLLGHPAFASPTTFKTVFTAIES